VSGGVVWDMAWPDEALGAACVDLRAGVVGVARDVLAGTWEGRDVERRAHVSAVLGAVAAGSNVADLWVREEPSNADASLLFARASVVRALAVFDRQGDAFAPLIGWAAQACRRAAVQGWSEDPTPWVAFLALERTRRWSWRRPQVDQACVVSGIVGPWETVEREIFPRAAHHREAGHRLLAYFSPRYGGRNEEHATVALWLSGQVEAGHPWRLLPVVAALEHDPVQERAAANARVASGVRAQRIRDFLTQIGPVPESSLLAAEVAHHRAQLEAALEAEEEPEPWEARRERIGRAVEETYRAWFTAVPDGGPVIPSGVPVTDVSLLAWGLYVSGRREWAGRVLRHMAPFASRYPWSRFGDAAEQFERVCRDCLGLVPLRVGPV
jgi:hypothetical protein